MKKSSKIIFVGFLLVVFVAVALGGYSIFKLVTKEYVSLTAEEFSKIMEENGFTTQTTINEEGVYLELVIADNGKYEVEYMNYDDAVEAKYRYLELKYDVENLKGSSYSQSENNINNMQKKSTSSNGKYGYVCRINNSIVYVNTSSTYKDEIKGIMKKLGY